MTEIKGIRENHKPRELEPAEHDSTDGLVTDSARQISHGFLRIADRLRKGASDGEVAVRILDEIDSIPNPITRAALYEVFGFDRQVAEGLAWRKEQGMNRFDSKGIANIGIKFADGQYGPKTSDFQETFHARAVQFDQAAVVFRELAMMDPTRREILSEVMDGAILCATVGADVTGIASLFKGGSASLFGKSGILGGAASLIGLAKNSADWSWTKKFALLPGFGLADLTRAYLGERNNFGKGMVQFMLLGLPGAGIVCEMADRAYGKPNVAPLPNISASDILETATRKP